MLSLIQFGVRWLGNSHAQIASFANTNTNHHNTQIILFVCLGSISYGYGSSIIATTTGQPTFLSYYSLDTRSDAAGLLGAMNGLFSTGGLFGCLSCFYIPDRFGRKRAILFAAFTGIVGSGLAAGSVHVAMFIVARLITGFSIGALVSLVPLYQSEISPPKIRGLLVGMHGAGIGMGYTSASWIGVGFYFVKASGTQWRMPLAIGALWPLLLAAGVLLIPESPRWRKCPYVFVQSPPGSLWLFCHTERKGALQS